MALPGKGDTKTPANIKNIPGALATAAAGVDVDFSGGDSPQRPDTPQNDDIMARGGMRSGLTDLGDVLKGNFGTALESVAEDIPSKSMKLETSQYGT